MLPLWNPYIFCGYPLMATLQVGFFYPLTLIYYILPFNLAFNYYIILHYFLAACFMFILLRHFELGRAASFMGGMIFSLSGYLLSVSNMNTSLSSVIWLPLTLLFFDRLTKEVTLKDTIILSILFALQFLGGEPTIIYVTLFFLAAYALTFSRSRLKSLGAMAVAGAIALGLVAVQLIPFLELINLSDRVVRTGYYTVTERSFPPREMITFLLPYFFGNPAHFGGYTETLLGKMFQDWLISPYIGILPLVFVFFSFKRKRSLFFLLSAVAALFLSFGRYTGFYRLIFFIPGISMVRYPVKYLFLFAFCLSILASFGFEELRHGVADKAVKIKKWIKAVLPILLVLLSIIALGHIWRMQVFNFFAQKYPGDMPATFFDLLASMIEFNLLSLFSLGAYLLGFMALLWAAYRGWISNFWFSGLLILVVAADLFANGYPIPKMANAWVFEKRTENFELMDKEKGYYRFFYTPELEEENRVIYGETYEEALSNTRDNFTSNWHIPGHYFDFYGYESIAPIGLVKFYHQKFSKDKIKDNIASLSTYNVKYIASINKIDLPSLRLLRHKRRYGLDVYLYENLQVWPRAYIPGGKAEITKYAPNEIQISAETDREGLLFLSEAYYPGWKALVDGKEEKSLQTNEFFRGVMLKPGKHEVRFVYDPDSVKKGGMITLGSVIVLALATLRAMRGKQKAL